MNTTKTVPAIAAALLALGTGSAFAQSGATLHSQQIPAGTEVKLTLKQTVDSSNAHVGDTVRAVTAPDDHSGLPEGTVFFGRVTQAKPATAKYPGALTVSFGIPRERNYDANNNDGNNSNQDNNPNDNGNYRNNNYSPAPRMAFSNAASAHLTGKAARSDKSNYTTIGAGAGALLGLARKGKVGDALGGAILGGAGGYAANAIQKRAGGDVQVKQGDELTARLDAPLVLRTEIVAPY